MRYEVFGVSRTFVQPQITSKAYNHFDHYSMKMQQHKVHIKDAALQRLQQKLALTDLPDDDLITTPWERGVPLTEITRLLDYWQNGFDWRKAENKINQFPQHMVQVNVEGFGSLQVHCIHKRSEAQHAIPLLFLHGWPGSFIEVTKMLPHLVKAEEDQISFHVIAPSLINFGFSSGVTTVGLSFCPSSLLIMFTARFQHS